MAAADLQAWAAKVERNLGLIFVNTATSVRDSVVEGSPVTGAPGQPADTGNLKSAWLLQFPELSVAEISTRVAYAPAIEENWVEPHIRRAHTRQTQSGLVQVRQHSVVGHVMTTSGVYPSGGGPHSVKLTRANFDRLVEDVTRKTIGA